MQCEHFVNILMTFYNYINDTNITILKQLQDYEKIGQDVQYIDFDYKIRIKNLFAANQINYNFLITVCMQYENIAKNYLKLDQNEPLIIPQLQISSININKLRSTLRQFVRDWSVQGSKERDSTYKPIIEEIQKQFQSNLNQINQKIKILVPGAGLARLAFDLAALGYSVQGNECSYFMLICSEYILNKCQNINQFTIYPYIHQFCNQYQQNDIFNSIQIPDINPSDVILGDSDFSMIAGDFVENYKDQKALWDSIVTCFFIDTGHNIIQYLKVIYNCLKKGGVWINMGPLLYHYADTPNELSIELSCEDLYIIIQKMGFQVQNQRFVETTYCRCQNTMLNITYNCCFFTAIKIQDNFI